MTEATDAEIMLEASKVGGLFDDLAIGYQSEDILKFARAVLARRGQPSGAVEAAEHYRNAIASACEGWTMPDGLRKHLETALWSPPNPHPNQAVPPAGREPLTDAQVRRWWERDNGLEDCELCKLGDFMKAVRAVEAAHGITKGGQHGAE